MENKQNLCKLALASLMMISTAHATPQLNDCFAEHTFLPVFGCGDNRCNGGSTPSYEIADNADKNRNEYYDPRANDINQPKAMTEPQLLGVLNTQTRTLYLNLDPEGKALALQLASQDSYKDKNLAVNDAIKRLKERREATKNNRDAMNNKR